MSDIVDLTIAQLHQGFRDKKFSSVEVTNAYLSEIEKKDPNIEAYVAVTKDMALEQAAAADKVIAESKSFDPLCGVPCSIKDSITVKGVQATTASRILENYIAPYDATVIARLKKVGSVILGKTNTDEFTMGISTENSAFKVTKNPHDTSRVAGGSSGGPAAAVAAREAAFSLGSDTGGSIRLPASFCGIVGLNPTYGAVSRYGAIALASSLDQIGPLTKNVEDTKLVFKVISGKDPKDAQSHPYEFADSPQSLKGLRIGIPREYFAEGIDSEVEKIVRSAIKKAEDAGAEIVDVNLPHTEHGVAVYYIIVPAEASANLARYDGIKYGLSIQEGNNLLDVYLKSRGKGFGKEPKRRILIGTYTLSAGYYDAYYKKAQLVRNLIKKDFIEAFKKVDVMFTPVSPIPAYKVWEKIDDPLSMYLMDIYTCPVKLAGIPALSIPAGFASPKEGSALPTAGKAGKLPVGLQIIGNYFEENKILSVASEMEKIL